MFSKRPLSWLLVLACLLFFAGCGAVDIPPFPEGSHTEGTVHHFWIFPLFPLFVIGGVWFWLLMLASLCWFFYILDDFRWGEGTATFILLALVLFTLGDFNFFDWAYEHPWYLLAYPFVGGALAVVRWACFSAGEKRKYKENRAAFFRDHGIQGDELPDQYRGEWYCKLLGVTPEYVKSSKSISQTL